MKWTQRLLSLMLALSVLVGMVPVSAMAATSGTCGDYLTWTLDDAGTLTISGTGDMKSKPWSGSCAQIKTLIIHQGVTGISSSAFSNCTNLTEIILPDGLTSIGDRAFSQCRSLSSIVLPSSVKSMGNLFIGCSNLTEITVEEGAERFFDIDGVLFSRNNNYNDNATLICCPGGLQGSYTVPEHTTAINSYAFYGCAGLSSVELPADLTSIRSFAFAECTGLESIKLPSGIVSIESSVFSGCTNLRSVTLPEGVASIGMSAFRGCKSLGNITIPETVTSIGNFAFYQCSNLDNILIPAGVSSIGENAFYYCSNLTNISIPNSITSLGKYVFAYCRSLSSITIPASVTGIGAYAFSGCDSLAKVYYDGSEEDWAVLLENTESGNDALRNVGEVVYTGTDEKPSEPTEPEEPTVPEENIRTGTCGDNTTWTFYENTGLLIISGLGGIKNYKDPRDMYAFASELAPWCSFSEEITEIEIEDNVSSVGDYAFSECSEVKKLTIPLSVKSVGIAAFRSANKLTDIYYNGTDSQWNTLVRNFKTGNDPLTSETVTIHTNWGEPVDTVSGSCGDHLTWLLNKETGELKISGSGEMDHYWGAPGQYQPEPHYTPWADSYLKIKTVTIDPGVTSIGSYAFAKCIYLTEISIPDTVKNIGHYAFSDCIRLTDVFYEGSKSKWNEIEISQTGNDSLLDIEIHYNGEIAYVPVVCYTNKKDSEKPEEEFVLASQVRATIDSYTYLGDDKGSIAVSGKPDDVVTFSKEGYISRSYTIAYLRENKIVRLYKESQAPIIYGLWLDGKDILHEEIILEYASEEAVTVTPEIDWGGKAPDILRLYQDGNLIELADGDNIIKLMASLDITQDIFLVATNADGQTAKKLLKVKSNTECSVYEGFSFKLGDGLEFELPAGLGLLSGTKMKYDLDIPVPVEVSYSDGKVLIAIGYRKDLEEDGKDKDEGIKNYVKFVKNATQTVKSIPNKWESYKKIQKDMKDNKIPVAFSDGSWGSEGDLAVMAFVEGTIIDGEFQIASSGGLIMFSGVSNFSKSFLAGPIPMFVEVSLSGELENEINLFLNKKIKAFTPTMTVVGTISLSGGLGLGMAKVAGISGGVKGSLISDLNIYLGSIDHFKLDADFSFYWKLKLLFATHSDSYSVARGTWYEYPNPVKAKASPARAGGAGSGKTDLYDISRFELDDLSYLTGKPGFYGRRTRNSAVGAGLDTTFVTNAYQGADPQTVFFSDGTRIAVWIGYNGEYTGYDGLNLFYSYYNGNWSEPQVVESDGTTDAAPDLKVVDDVAYLVWQDASGSVNGRDTLADMADMMDISAAVFDRESGNFTAYAVTENSGVLNMQPKLCGEGSSVYVVWQRNGKNDWFGQNYANNLMYSGFTGDGWGGEGTLYSGLGPLMDFDVTYTDGIQVAYSMDGDGDLNTQEDVEVYINGSAVTDNGYLDSGVTYNGSELYWYSGSKLLCNGHDTMAEDVHMGSDRFQILNENGVCAVIYAEEDGLASILYASYYDDASGCWGRPIVLYDNGTSISDFCASVTPEGEISILIQNQEVVGSFENVNSDGTIRDPYGTVNLEWYNAPLGCNLRVVDIRYSNENYVENQNMPVRITVSNAGELVIRQILVEFVDESGNVIQSRTVEEQLLSGETKEISVPYRVEKVIPGRKVTVRVTPVGKDEINTEDNTAEMVLAWNDLAVEDICYGTTEKGSIVIHASIVNRGYEQQKDIKVNLIPGAVSGTVADTATVDVLDALTQTNVYFELADPSQSIYYVSIEHKDTDCDYSNDLDFVKISDVSAHVHHFREPVFVWKSCMDCEATFVCEACKDVYTIACVVTGGKIPATSEETETSVHNATAEFNGQTYTDTKTVSDFRQDQHLADSKWYYDETSHWQSCVICSEKIEVSEHSAGIAGTENTSQTCTVCACILQSPTHLSWFFDALEESGGNYLWASGYYSKIMEQYGPYSNHK